MVRTIGQCRPGERRIVANSANLTALASALGGAIGDVCGATAELGQLAALLAFAATTLK